MNLPWFKRNELIFIPASVIGWLITPAGLIYAAYVFIDIDRIPYSVSDTLISFVFNLIIIGAVYFLIGYLTSRSRKA